MHASAELLAQLPAIGPQHMKQQRLAYLMAAAAALGESAQQCSTFAVCVQYICNMCAVHFQYMCCTEVQDSPAAGFLGLAEIACRDGCRAQQNRPCSQRSRPVHSHGYCYCRLNFAPFFRLPLPGCKTSRGPQLPAQPLCQPEARKEDVCCSQGEHYCTAAVLLLLLLQPGECIGAISSGLLEYSCCPCARHCTPEVNGNRPHTHSVN
jgi:hypothetical protein